MSLVLDVVEVPVSHSGLNLADAFAKMLEDMGLDAKVSRGLLNAMARALTDFARFSA